MCSVTGYVGLDYHQKSVQVCVMNAEGQVLVNRSCENVWWEIDDVVRRHVSVVHGAIEACCGAAHLAEELSRLGGWSIHLAHPGFVRRMKQNPDKTDHSDARLLADLERVGYLPRVWLAPESLRELRRLVRYRQQLVNQKRSVKLRIRALLRDHRLRPSADFRSWTQLWRSWLKTVSLGEESRWIMDRHLESLEHLEKSIQSAEKRLRKLSDNDAVIEKLLGFSGIGLITAVTLRAEIGHFDRFRDGKQLSRFCGLSPRNASSGERQADAGLIKAGNKQLRATIIETAHRLKRYDARWMKFSLRLREKGKPGSVIAAAVANRWMRWLYHQMQPQQLVV